MDLFNTISPIIAVGIGTGVALYIHWRRRRDSQAELIKKKVDVHKELWFALQAMQAQAKRPNGVDKYPHEMENPYDINWLREHFRKNAAMLSKSLHDEYYNLIKQDNRAAFSDAWEIDLRVDQNSITRVRGYIKKRNLLLVDLIKMENLALGEWKRLEVKYKQMNGLESKFVD